MKMREIWNYWWFQTLVVLVVFLVGAFGGWYIKSKTTLPIVTEIRDPETGYSHINPILYVQTPEDVSYPLYTPLKNDITSYVAAATAAHPGTEVSVYFRDLNSSKWVGVNSNLTFTPASMLKVITLLALFRRAETSPQILSEKIAVGSNIVIPSGDQDFFPPTTPVVSGNTYTVQDLTQRLIQQSDNGANALLIQYVGDTTMSAVFHDLHVPLPNSNSGITAQDYSHLFRVLYNATYLTSADSEKALTLLTQTTFTKGLVAGVPSGVVVAHKFGETTLPAVGSSEALVHELHDCGIIYYSQHPYFLCVMTRGTDFSVLAQIIQNVSSRVWKQATSLYPV